MTRDLRTYLAVLAFALLPLTGCARAAEAEAAPGPAVVQKLDESLATVTLTERAAERIGILTDTVREQAIDGQQRKVMPYAAVLYDPDGTTWAYTNPEPLVFVRQAMTIDRIKGDLAILSDGPATGTAVVTRGAAELHGEEFGVGDE